MRKSPTRPARLAAAFAAAVFVALCATLLPAALAAESSPLPEPAASSGSPAPLTTDPSPSPTPSPTPVVTSITCTLSAASVVYGDKVTVSGVVTPAVEGLDVTVAVNGTDVGTARTDATGAYTVDVVPHGSGDVIVRVVADGTTSTAQPLVVKPHVSITHSTAIPFLQLPFVVKVTPSSYAGTIKVRVVHRGATVATLKARVRSGKATLKVPLRGINLFKLSFEVPADGDLGARTVDKSVKARWTRIANGSTGPRVRGLLAALSRLKIRVPYIGSTFNSQCGDAVVAFQKAYRLSRSYVFDADDWRKLDGAKPIKPRHSSPKTHIEVDKGRQILMVVKNGAVYGLIAVSTGATNNTPEGSFHIQQKHPYTTSGYGGILFRTMGFVGNFAIHGYSPVPPYPASHGCIREPMWVADWTYNQSWVGERLYVYH